jgi:hypothetical protein
VYPIVQVVIVVRWVVQRRYRSLHASHGRVQIVRVRKFCVRVHARILQHTEIHNDKKLRGTTIGETTYCAWIIYTTRKKLYSLFIRVFVVLSWGYDSLVILKRRTAHALVTFGTAVTFDNYIP